MKYDLSLETQHGYANAGLETDFNDLAHHPLVSLAWHVGAAMFRQNQPKPGRVIYDTATGTFDDMTLPENLMSATRRAYGYSGKRTF